LKTVGCNSPGGSNPSLSAKVFKDCPKGQFLFWSVTSLLWVERKNKNLTWLRSSGNH
jgi:hypothetical protein